MIEAIRQRARDLGFDDCRFTTADPPASAVHFQRWLAAQHHGDMAWLQRNAHKRVDPQQVLPGAKTILTLAASYAQGGEDGGLRIGGRGSRGEQTGAEGILASSSFSSSSSSSEPAEESRMSTGEAPSGRVARYAQYADYHDVLGQRLKALAEFMDQLGGAGTRSLWYVDTGPLLERDLAQRAGLGFIGKHTNLISRQLGNWFFLAEILTTLELEPDAPEKNRCGACARCLAACPTGAITAPFQLDARRCISYLTIELKGPIPFELRPLIGNRVFGCDDCLAACPWNRFARQGRLMQPHARPDLAAPDLLELLALDEARFKRRFAGTPIHRSKRRDLLRNVCVALGNLGDPAAIPALEQAALGPDPLIAEHARWALEKLRNRD